MSESKMITAGYISMDITPAFPMEYYQGRTLEEVIRPGKLREVGRADASPGGCVSNTGLAMFVLGADVSLVAKVGDDAFGHMIAGNYRNRGASPEFIVSKDDETSYTIVISVPGSDRCFLVDPGANDHFYPEDLDMEKVAARQYFHFGYPALMRSIYQDGGVRLAGMYRSMQETGLITSLDMAMPDAGSDSGKADWEGLLKKTLPYVDFFVPSIEELGFMLDRERYEYWQRKTKETGKDICMTLSLKDDVRPLARKALDMGCGSILLKCGAAGMYFLSSPEDHMLSIAERMRAHARECNPEQADAAEGVYTGIGWGDRDLFQDSFKPDRILSGTGAGDTAIAGFLYGISHGMDPETCLKIAAGCGSMCITQYDSLSGLLPIPELMKRIESGWELQHFIQE